MRESTKTIFAFVKLIKERNSIFSANTWQALTNLNQSLEELKTEADFDIANTILDWCDQHPEIKNSLTEACQNIDSNIINIKADIVENEEQLKEEYNLREEGVTINNKFLVRQTIQNAIIQPPPNSNSQSDE